jgi:UDP-N-acetyl-D-mannosaminuronic acid transferase (WecB/TagA/CpsF family)
VKRYVAEPGSDAVRTAMQAAAGWFMCRVGFVETARAVGLVAGESVVRRFAQEWPAFGVVEVDQDLADRAAELAVARTLRSLAALHLASALLLPRAELWVATWDSRLSNAARDHGLRVLPERLD